MLKRNCNGAVHAPYWLVVGLVMLAALSASTLHADREPSRRAPGSAPGNAAAVDDAPAPPTNVAGTVIGPDVIVSRIDGVLHYTSGGAINGLHSYSVGTTACNIGDAEAVWVQATNQHPVIGQSLFRYTPGRFEQIGQSWLKHGFCAVNGTGFCDVCQPTDPVCPTLGIGCADTYGPSLNGNATYLGPKYQVNAATGVFPYPHPAPTGPTSLRGRLLALQDDIDPALNPDARCFVQAQYITPDEPSWGTHLNNCAYRRIVFDETTFAPALQGPTVEQVPAITKWAELDAGVELTIIDVPNDGRLYLASRATQLNPTTWSYEYALFNMNSDRAVGWFSLPIESGAAVSDVGFHDVDYHSGEPYSGADWDVLETYAAVTWATEPYAVNVNANALRWGTLYNFRLTSNVAPSKGTIVLGLFKPAGEGAAAGAGGPASIEVTAVVPGVTGANCVGDIVSNVTFQPPPDGAVDAADLASLLSWWGVNPGSPADLVSNVTFAPPPDGVVDAADLAYLLGAWGDCD